MEIVQFSSGMNLRGEHHDGHGSDCTDDLSLRLDTADYLEQSLDLFEQGKLEMAETKLQNAFRSFRRIKPNNFNNPSDQEKILVERGRKVFQRKISVQNFGVVLMDQLTSRDDSKFYATFINVFDALARKLRRYDLVLDISKARTDFFRGIASNEKDVDLVGASESDEGIFRNIMMKTDNQPVLGQNLENFSSMVIENGFLSFGEVTGYGCGFFTTENKSVNCQDETTNPLTISEVRTSKVQATTPPNISKDADGLAERPTYPSQTETEEESSGWLSTEGSAVGGLGLVNRNANRSEDDKSGDCKPTVGETSSISERKLKEKQEREKTMKKNEQTRPLWNDKAEMPEEVRPQDEIQNTIERNQSNFFSVRPCLFARHSVDSSITTPFDDVRNTAESANRGFSNTFSRHQSIDISKARTDFFRGIASNEKDVDLVGASESDEGIFRNIMMKTDNQPVLGQNLENFSSMVIENGFLSFGEVTGYGCGFFTTENKSVNCQDETTNPLTISEVRTSKVQATTPPNISKDADGLAERPTYPSQTETEEESSGWLSTEGSAVGGLGLVNRNANRSEDDKSGDCKPTVGETSSISERKLKEKQEREKTMKKNEQTRPLWNDKAEMPEEVRPQDEIQNTIERNQSNFFSVRPCLFARHSVDSSITTPFDDVRNTAESANRGFSNTFSRHQSIDISKARTDFFRGIASNEKDVDLVGASESDEGIFRNIMMKTDNQPVLGQNLENFSSMVIENGFLSFGEVTGYGCGFFTTENKSVNCQDETTNPLTISEVRTSKVQATTPPNISKDADGLAERPTYPSQTETEEESSGWLSTEGSAVGGLGLVNRNANRSEDDKSGDCKPTVGETSSISERKLKEKQEREKTMKKNEQTRPLWNDKAEMPEEVRPQDEIQNTIERNQSNFFSVRPCLFARHSVDSSITTPFDDVRNTAESANRGFSDTFSKHQGSSCFTDKQGYLTCETSKLADQDTANQGPLGILKETSSLSKDDSLADQERRVAVNCSLVEKTLREREVKEKTMKQKERRGIEDRARKEKQAHENREREATESRETERSNLREEGNSTSGGRETLQQMIMSETSCLERKWRERDEESMKKKGWAWKERFQDRQNGNQSEKMSSTGVESDRSISQNSAGAAAYNWQCEHHQRLCLFKFPCCKIFFPCNVCHANSGCRNVDAKERDARFVKCSVCGNQQQVCIHLITSKFKVAD